MKVSYVEGLANHNGPESCGAAREGGDEALTGESTGRVFSRVRKWASGCGLSWVDTFVTTECLPTARRCRRFGSK